MNPNHSDILVIEDDKQIQIFLKYVLEKEHYACQQAETGEQALTRLEDRPADVILLDLGLPDIDGMDLITKIRSRWDTTPILVISARDQDEEKAAALDLGADDYLTKPFSSTELLARIRVICRRLEQTGSLPETEVFVNGGLEIRYQEQEVRLDGKLLHLTPMEYRILVLFSRNAGKVLTRNFLTTQIWNSSWSSDMTNLRVYMTMLRKKLDHRFIETSFGVGYKMVREEQEAGL